MFNIHRFFLEPDGGVAGGASTPTPEPSQTPEPTKDVTIDYDKLANLISGKQTVTEDTVLKNYFKQQGLSADEAKTAMEEFKKQKAQNTPNIESMQADIASKNKQLEEAMVEKAVMLEAMNMGIKSNTLPYILKLADLSSAIKDGKVDEAKVKEAISKVLEDVPGLKPANDDTRGIRVGAAAPGTRPEKPAPVVASKRWNRFNY